MTGSADDARPPVWVRHVSFTLLDPNGYRITVNSFHASGKPV